MLDSPSVLDANDASKHDVPTTLNYWKDPGDGSAPTPIYIGKGRITNERPHLAHSFTISDVTGNEEQFNLDTRGFEWLHHSSAEKDFTNEPRIRDSYYPECC